MVKRTVVVLMSVVRLLAGISTRRAGNVARKNAATRSPSRTFAILRLGTPCAAAYRPRDVPAPTRQTIDATTRYCAVFGHPVKHSASPAFQNAGIAEAWA